ERLPRAVEAEQVAVLREELGDRDLALALGHPLGRRHAAGCPGARALAHSHRTALRFTGSGLTVRLVEQAVLAAHDSASDVPRPPPAGVSRNVGATSDSARPSAAAAAWKRASPSISSGPRS